MQNYLIWNIILYFMIYSFAGWIIEVIHRSINQRRFVNAGFLYGPFLPLYGLSSLVILLLKELLKDTNIIITFFIFGIAVSLIEYATGMASEKFFHFKLWDYRNNRFNIRGKICLLYSVLWASLAIVFIYFIHPAVRNYIERIDRSLMMMLSVAFILYIFADLFASVLSLQTFRRKISYLVDNYLNLENLEIDKLLKPLTRHVRAFPDLNKFMNKNISDRFKNQISTFISGLNLKFHEIKHERKPAYSEYYSLVGDILNNNEFKRLREFRHHNSSIYDHVLDVSYVSYEISKYLNLDFRSAARGALLHDFFLYNWRNHDEPELAREKLHGLWHPSIALKNAKREFVINETEEDIIIKHMWPLTPIPPRYRESFVVTFADKYISSKELLSEVKKKIKEKI